MSSESSQVRQQDLSVEKCLRGEEGALAALREQFQPMIAKVLLARGASSSETDDVLADLWADCIPGGDPKPSLLEKFKGKCTIGGWLATVATNRWVDLKRRQERRKEFVQDSEDEGGEDLLSRLPASLTPVTEESLVALLREGLQAAFATCSGQAIGLLKLVYVHGLTQREVGQMLGWGEWKVSRVLSEALEQIEKETMRSIKERDPWLELTWQDFVDLCRTYDLGFG